MLCKIEINETSLCLYSFLISEININNMAYLTPLEVTVWCALSSGACSRTVRHLNGVRYRTLLNECEKLKVYANNSTTIEDFKTNIRSVIHDIPIERNV